MTERDQENAATHRFGKWNEPLPLRVLQRLDFYLWLVVGTVCIGAFMGQVDASIAQLVLPELRRQFHEPVHLVAWVAIAYLLVVTVMLPIVGRLADILGRKLSYCCGFLVFVVGSGLSGLAPGLDVLIGARVLQAVGSSLMMANSVAIIVATVGPARRGRALGVQAAAQAVGFASSRLLAYVLDSGVSRLPLLTVLLALRGSGQGCSPRPTIARSWGSPVPEGPVRSATVANVSHVRHEFRHLARLVILSLQVGEVTGRS